MIAVSDRVHHVFASRGPRFAGGGNNVVHAALFGLVTLGLAQCALAQKRVETDTGTRIPVPLRARVPDVIGPATASQARVVMAEFSRCTVDRKIAVLSKLLSLPANRIESARWGPLAEDDCMADGTLRFKAMTMRGAVFGELYRRRQDALQHGKPWSLPVVPVVYTERIDPDDTNPVNTALVMFAACVIDRAPDKARAVLASPSASTAQDAAITALGPDLGPCLPQGRTITLNKSIIEGALGEALYRGHIMSKSGSDTK